MSGWIVYSKDGSIERCKLKSLEYGGTAMGERAVTATFDYHSEVAFEVFDYIEYRGERFELEAVPTVKKLSSFEYQYELRFVSLKYELERCEMRDLSPSDNGVVYPTPLTFSFTGDVRYLTDRIQACLDAMYGTDVWKIIIADETSSEEKNITIAQQNCWNALALVNSTYGLNFYIKGRTITIGGEQPLVSHTFEYGKGNGLYEIERASDTETGIVTKLRAYGSTKNLDYSYPKKPEWSDSVLPISFALSPLRLMLPSFKTDGKTDYVLADNAAIAKYGIREASMVYDDIYPSITGAVNSKGEPMDEIKSVDEVDESKSTFVVYLHDLEFDLEEHLTTEDAQISMKTGTLQGYTFNMTAIDRLEDGSYKITFGRNSLENSEESGAYVPSKDWNMKAGDKFVLLHILLPQKYIREAENRLLARAQEYLAQYSKTNFSYNIGLHDKFLIQNPSVYDSLIEGSKLKVYDKEIGINEEVTIQSITITENAEDNILPQVKVTLNNEPSASTLDRIQGKLNEVAAETAANGFTTQSEIMAQYRRKLDKPFFDKLFVAIDANGNEIASTDVITPIAYIKAKYHVASVGGFTMYAMDKDVNIPSLASGLPFDGRTIWYNPDTQQIEVIGGTGGGSGEGVSNFWDLSGIPSWITNSKPKYTYSEIEGTPDLTRYALVSQIPSLSGYATESWVTQQNYATKATTLSGYGITDAYTKTNVDDLLKSYVTLGGTQTITGEKNFTGGLKVNGSPIVYDSTKKYWKLEGDLLVTGGVTMYGSDSSFVPSTIMDAIAVDGTTISKSGGVLKVIGGTGGGGLDITALQNYLTQNSYLNVTSGDNRYLKLSGGTITASNGVYIVNFNSTDGKFCVNSYQINGVNKGDIGYLNDSGRAAIYMFNKKGDAAICVGDDGEIYKGNANNFALHKIWHSGNDGSGSGLDADLLDGQQGSWYRQNVLGFARYDYTNNTASERDANAVTDGMLYNYGSTNYWKNTPSGLSYGQILSLSSANDTALMGQLAWDINNASTSDTTRTLWWRGIQSKDNISYAKWHQIAFTDSNVASATKLQTARTIWGQSFDGTGNIDGVITINQSTTNASILINSTHASLPQSFITFQSNGVDKGNVGWTNASGTHLYNASTRKTLELTNDGELKYGAPANGAVIWRADNSNLSTVSWTTSDLYCYCNGAERQFVVSKKSYTWGGLVNSYPLIGTTSTADNNIYTMLAFPHIPYLKNGSRSYNGNSFGSLVRFEGDVTNGKYWDVGCPYESPNNLFIKCDGKNIASWGDTGLMGIYVPNLWLSSSMLVLGRKDASLMTNQYAQIGVTDGNIHVDAYKGYGIYLNFYQSNTGVVIDKDCNLLVSGGITMYSDQRKKTILNHVELSLKQIADAPLVEHYYNSDESKTTHVGSIAQYWASMNDWFCKLDSEGFYTMEIQNAALASAISIARELDKYETKTDKAIKKLKKRICELEEEVERLKSA